MYLSLSPGLLGIQTDFRGALDLAARHGFQGVDSTATELASLNQTDITELRQEFATLKLRPGYFGLDPVVISAPDEAWATGVELLHSAAPMARALGYTRAIAVVMPFSETRDYQENFAFHLTRLKQILPLLAENGISLGIEYVAPLTRRASFEHHFIHNLQGALELIAAAQAPNLGLLLDSFHWFCAGETAADIASLPASRIVAVHLNDAVKGRTRDEQLAFERELPGASGEIDIRAFVQALQATNYAGPLSCEPMNKALNEMDNAQAAALTSSAMQAVFPVESKV